MQSKIEQTLETIKLKSLKKTTSVRRIMKFYNVEYAKIFQFIDFTRFSFWKIQKNLLNSLRRIRFETIEFHLSLTLAPWGNSERLLFKLENNNDKS